MSERNIQIDMTDGTSYEVPPERAELYTFMGQLAMYDNVTMQLSLEPPLYTRLFRDHPAFEPLSEFMIENEYPAHHNLRYVPEAIQKSFDSMIDDSTADLDSIPDDWLEQ